LSFGQAAVIALVIGCALLWKSKGNLSHFRSLTFLWVLLGAAVTTAGGNYMMIQLSLQVSALVQFPVVNGALVITSILVSRVLFKEQVTKRHLQAIAVGLIAIVMLSI
jgi:drug/metabolite transporter (DMT)-like permease